MTRWAEFGMSPLLGLIYRRGRGMAPVYHRVLPDGGPRPRTSTQIAEADLTEQLRFLSARCRVLPMDDFVDRLRRRCLPPRACTITFDDGFADNADLALPILRRLGLPATFFIASGYVVQGRPYEADALHDVLHLAEPRERIELDLRPWGGPALSLPYADPADRSAGYFKVLRTYKRQVRWTQRPAFIDYCAERFGVAGDRLARPPMMTPDQVRAMSAAGMTIGSHTEWHISLAAEGPVEFGRQLRASRQTLEEMTGQPVKYFSYPYGDPEYCIPAAGLVQEVGYEAAFMAAGTSARVRYGPWLIDRQATNRGMVGLWASLLGVKPSQARQRRAMWRCFAAEGDKACT